MIELGKVRPDEEKIAAFRRLLAPSTVRQLRAFLGLGGFYRRFIKHFARIAAPLFLLLQKDREWEWGEAQDQAFKKLKDALSD